MLDACSRIYSFVHKKNEIASHSLCSVLYIQIRFVLQLRHGTLNDFSFLSRSLTTKTSPGRKIKLYCVDARIKMWCCGANQGCCRTEKESESERTREIPTEQSGTVQRKRVSEQGRLCERWRTRKRECSTYFFDARAQPTESQLILERWKRILYANAGLWMCVFTVQCSPANQHRSFYSVNENIFCTLKPLKYELNWSD